MKIAVAVDTLTREEIKMLKRLQIEIVVKKIPKSRNKIKKQIRQLKPYSIEIFYSCLLCKSEFSKLFQMSSFKKGLRSKKLKSPLILSNVKEERKVGTCPYCKKVLSKLTKDAIINKYLKEKGVRYARQKQCGGNFR